MAIAATQIASLNSTSNASSYTSSTASPSANARLYAIVQSHESGSVEPMVSSAAVTGWGLTWSQVVANYYDSSSVTHKLTIFSAATTTAPGSGSFSTGTMPNGTATGCQMSIIEVTGHNVTTPHSLTNIKTGTATGTAASVTMDALEVSTHTYLAAFGTDGTATWTKADAGATDIAGAGGVVISNPDSRFAAIWGPVGDSSPTGTWGTSRPWGGVAIELRIESGDISISIPAEVAAVAAVDTPTVTIESSPTITPDTVAGVTAIATPSITADADVALSTVAAVAAIDTPAVTTELTITLTTVEAEAAVDTPVVTDETPENANVFLEAVEAVAAIPLPPNTADANVICWTVDDAVYLVDGSQAVDGYFHLAALVAVPTPALTVGILVELTTVAAVVAVPTPTVTADDTANASPVPDTVEVVADIPRPHIRITPDHPVHPPKIVFKWKERDLKVGRITRGQNPRQPV
jgi:hypothetical protein